MAFRLLEFTIAGQGDRKIIVSSRGVGRVHFQHGALGRNLTFVIFELFGGSAKFFLPCLWLRMPDSWPAMLRAA